MPHGTEFGTGIGTGQGKEKHVAQLGKRDQYKKKFT
jgi:hypothetical protein